MIDSDWNKVLKEKDLKIERRQKKLILLQIK